jgi:hypothetical protein
MATAGSQAGVDLGGWKKIEGMTFRYTDGGRTQLQVYSHEVLQGESVTIPQGNWTGGLLLLPPGEEESEDNRPLPAIPPQPHRLNT